MSKLAVNTESGATYVIDFAEMTWGRTTEQLESGIAENGKFIGIQPIVLGRPLVMTAEAATEQQRLGAQIAFICTSSVLGIQRIKDEAVL